MSNNRSTISLKVNGEERAVDVLENMPLLWVLRDILGLKGSKFGCGIGQCGACTVHIDGIATRSCITPVSTVSEYNILTIEGFVSNRDHPIPKAWIELDVPQCGYCQSGQMLSAATLLSQQPYPSESDINAAMSGNICRCGTYLDIKRAIYRASDLMQEAEKE